MLDFLPPLGREAFLCSFPRSGSQVLLCRHTEIYICVTASNAVKTMRIEQFKEGFSQLAIMSDWASRATRTVEWGALFSCAQ